ncbi:hypothetical protein J2X04_000649 [Lysobacter niabensis]|uniref:O-antigen ligase family protein n=1 Tax=Agrilutibacter niabensis TaxID=380628 RepID=A0ABU1VLG7_9GAMM|nr:hypothetical protein [Lysobacter niabensis]MDR7098302.1 hypothetical protein [Lysobacter niabensis]
MTSEAGMTHARFAPPPTLRVGQLYLRLTCLLVGVKLLASVLLAENDDAGQSAYAVLPKIVDALILALGAAGIAVAPSTRRKWRIIGASLALLVVVLFSQALAARSMVDGLLNLAKFLAPLLLLSGGILTGKMQYVRSAGARALVWWIGALTLIGLFAVEPSFRNGKEWLPAYFGGTHTSAYVAVLAIGLVMITRTKSWHREPLVLVSLFMLYMIVLGWGVRTAMSAGLVASAYLVLAQASAKQRFMVLLVSLLAGLCGLIFAVSTGLLSAESLEWFSSGRTSVWIERIATISRREVGELLLGTGAGTNVTASSVWWWHDKDSHNDFIAVVYEQGLLGLVLTCGLLVSAYRLSPFSIQWKALWLMYLACSVLSNGLMFRPTPACVFAVAAIMASRSRPGVA